MGNVRHSSRWLVPGLVLIACGLGGCGGENPPAGESESYAREPVNMPRLDYPATRTVDVVDDYHGTAVPDPYRWLEDPDTPDARAWIAAQNLSLTDVFINYGAEEVR